MVWIIFLISAIAIVIAAIHLANNADVIAIRTGLGGALVGILLVASTTSLPEILTIISSIRQGTPDIAAGNLLGSNMFNIVLLAVLDMAGRNERVLRKAALKHALTGSMAVFMIGLAVLFLIIDTDLMIGWIGFDSITLVLAYILAIYLIRKNSSTDIVTDEDIPEDLPSMRRAVIGFTLAAATLVIATPILVDASAEIAEITGLGTSFIGTTLVAMVTSLPELVICITAIRIGAHEMAIGNLFGSNMFNMFILGATDIFYTQGRFLAAIDNSFILVGILGLLFPPVPAVASLDLPVGNPPTLFPAGEAEAQRRLAGFLAEPVYHYTDARNRMDLEGTSRLSPYLRFGMLSARSAAFEIMQLIHETQDKTARENCQTWLNELIWREFYYSIFYHYPNVQKEAFQEKMRWIQWRDRPAELQTWKDGLTGYPVVDAAMRQLSQTGWIHNRARMITASFLVKDLLINWQEGESWFMEQLVDGDPASNNGGWQWTAGVGTDAAPYFRIFNPVSQGKKFDPHGDYVRRFVPELKNVPGQYIHEPWLMPLDVQTACGVHIRQQYPQPMVDHALARQRTLAAYKMEPGS